MSQLLRFLMMGILLCVGLSAFSQIPNTPTKEWGTDLDSLRDAEELAEDSIIYDSKYIRYTTLEKMESGTFTVPLDTTLRGFQYYNPQNLPTNPSINLGNYGLATRDLLFNPDRSIGFQTGFHSLERYVLNPDSIHYYRNRAPYSELYFVTTDQVFKAM